MSASVAFGGLTACTRQPLEKIVPYVSRPEEIIPGRPLYFATGMETRRLRPRACWPRATWGGRRRSKATRSIRGARARPTSTRRPRCSISTTRTATRRSRSSGAFAPGTRSRTTIARLIEEAPDGLRLRILTGPVTSPTAHRAHRRPCSPSNRKLGGTSTLRSRATTPCKPPRSAFGRAVGARYDFSRADVVLSLDADFLTQGPGRRALRSRVHGPTPGARGRERDQPPVRRRDDARLQRAASRTIASPPRPPSSALSPPAWPQRSKAAAPSGTAGRAGRRHRARPRGTPRPLSRRGRRARSGRGADRRSLAQREPRQRRQHRHLPRARRGAARRRHGVAQPAHGRHERR